MGRFLLFSLLLVGVFFGGRYAAQKWDVYHPAIATSMPTCAPSIPAPYALENRPFAILIVGFNNGAVVGKTLRSVFSQNYENYRAIYIDDASDDGSFELARDLIYESGHMGQVTFVHNEQRLGMLANLSRAVELLSDEEIAVVLHGEDWLAHEWVLQRLNAYYASSDVWMTFGQSRDFPTYQLGSARPYKEASVRSEPFTATHLKTFYAGLFKKVRPFDLMSGGKFLQAYADLAYMIPMLELAGPHAQFISEVLYIQNRQGNYKEDREVQLRCEKFIRGLDVYPALTCLFSREKCGE